MSTWLIDEDTELSVPGDNRFRKFFIRETEQGLNARLAADPKAAATFVKTQAVNGSVEAGLAWGHMLLNGHGVAAEPEAALRWFMIVARTGNADAINMVGRCYELGWGVQKNATEAARWYRLAAAKHHAWAEFNLASLLAQGNGVEPNHREALTLLVRSARRGNAKAMNMIGRYREEGVTGSPKPRSAARWYRMAAERGCFRGQFHHARFLADAGRIDEAERFFRASLSHAPADFRADALALLQTHPVNKLRQIGHDTGALPA